MNPKRLVEDFRILTDKLEKGFITDTEFSDRILEIIRELSKEDQLLLLDICEACNDEDI